MSNRSRAILIPLGVALLYVLCAKLGLALSFRAAQVTAVWPPTGFALAAILLFGRRAAAGVLLGAFLANATASEPLWVAAGIAIGNTLEAWTGALLLRRVRFDARLAHVRDVIALLGALVVSPVVAATIGVAALGLGGVQPIGALPELWWIWWLGDALGGLLVAPLILVWSSDEPVQRRRGAVVEGTLLVVGLLAASGLVFLGRANVLALEYVVFPFLIWAALRFGPAGSATAAIVANAIAVWGTHLGRGPFAGAGPERGLVLLQVFMAVAVTTGLLLGAASAQSRREHERKDEFLAMLSHELRNPLAPILHALELLDLRGDDDAARDVIRRQAQHMARLVDDLLDVARITRGEVQLERRPVTVAEVVNAAAGTWRHLIEQRKQKLSIWLPDQPLMIDADPLRFTQIIANLLHNASKFTPVGGRISITAREEGGSLVLRVRDNGEGMSAEMLAHAFEPFVQGAAGGLGLGLTLVRRLVELHGGTIEATSDGRGTEMTLRMATVAAADAKAPVPIIAISTRSRRVLVVEDNNDARIMLSELLVARGHEVETAADGAGAIVAAQRFVPEVVLLDIGLPGADGYTVARELRGIPECASALLVAVTGYGQPEDRARARDAGFDEHLLKPVEAEKLLSLLH